MRRDSALVREERPFVFANCRTGEGVDAIVSFLESAARDHAHTTGPWSRSDHHHH
jgi:Ni2+-binding GTPase involved in maturation of urease and hydrogenase